MYQRVFRGPKQTVKNDTIKKRARTQTPANRQAFILEAEGRSQAITSVYRAIREANPDPSLIGILQLETLGKFAESDNAKIVVPFESAALLGAAQALRSVLDSVPAG